MTSKPIYSTSQVLRQLSTSWDGSAAGSQMAWAASRSQIGFSISSGMPLNSGQSAPEGRGYVAMDARQIASASLAFQLWDDLIANAAGTTQRLVNTGSPTASITLDYSSRTAGQTYDVPFLSNPYSQSKSLVLRASQIWLAAGVATNGDSGMVTGGYGQLTMIHEIGHALGLSHPGSYNAGGGNEDSISYANSAVFAQDNRQFTVMSYFGGYLPGSGWQQDGSRAGYVYPQTPMLYDIAAIQAKYGADFSTRSASTVYGFNCSLAAGDPERAIYSFSQNRAPVFTIWDGGGVDTLDCSAYSGSQSIDLTPATYSSLDGLTDNIGIAFNCFIERAIGGSGNDALTGIGGARLTGGLGQDIFKIAAGTEAVTDLGRGGADALQVAAGAVLTATAAAAWSATAATVNLGSATLLANGFNLNLAAANAGAAAAHGFVLSNAGAARGASMAGSAQADRLIAGTGADVLTGAGGADSFEIGAGLGSALRPLLITDYQGGAGGDAIQASDVLAAGHHLAGYAGPLAKGWALNKGFAGAPGAAPADFYAMAAALPFRQDSVLSFTDGKNDYLFIMGEANRSHDSFVELVGTHYAAAGGAAAPGVILLA